MNQLAANLKTQISRLETLPFGSLSNELRARIVKLGTATMICELEERLRAIPVGKAEMTPFTPAEAALDMSELAGDTFLHPAVLTEE